MLWRTLNIEHFFTSKTWREGAGRHCAHSVAGVGRKFAAENQEGIVLLMKKKEEESEECRESEG